MIIIIHHIHAYCTCIYIYEYLQILCKNCTVFVYVLLESCLVTHVYEDLLNLLTGTWFIQSLCDVLEDDEVTGEEDMGLLVCRVNEKMVNRMGPKGERQIAEYQHSARRGLYLFPGIDDTILGRTG